MTKVIEEKTDLKSCFNCNQNKICSVYKGIEPIVYRATQDGILATQYEAGQEASWQGIFRTIAMACLFFERIQENRE